MDYLCQSGQQRNFLLEFRNRPPSGSFHRSQEGRSLITERDTYLSPSIFPRMTCAIVSICWCICLSVSLSLCKPSCLSIKLPIYYSFVTGDILGVDRSSPVSNPSHAPLRARDVLCRQSGLRLSFEVIAEPISS